MFLGFLQTFELSQTTSCDSLIKKYFLSQFVLAFCYKLGSLLLLSSLFLCFFNLFDFLRLIRYFWYFVEFIHSFDYRGSIFNLELSYILFWLLPHSKGDFTQFSIHLLLEILLQNVSLYCLNFHSLKAEVILFILARGLHWMIKLRLRKRIVLSLNLHPWFAKNIIFLWNLKIFKEVTLFLFGICKNIAIRSWSGWIIIKIMGA